MAAWHGDEALKDYNAVVLGGAAYMFHWLRDATKFAKRHQAELQQRRVWLFSRGPLGADQFDEAGHNVREAARPKELQELTELLKPRGEEVFLGACDPQQKPIGLGERITRMMPAATDALPAGDFRDWERIDAWTRQIAQLTTSRLRNRKRAWRARSELTSWRA